MTAMASGGAGGEINQKVEITIIPKCPKTHNMCFSVRGIFSYLAIKRYICLRFISGAREIPLHLSLASWCKWDLFIYGTFEGRQSSVKRFMWLFSLALSLSQVSTLLFYSGRTFHCVSLVPYIFVWLVWNRYFLSSRERIHSNCSTKNRRRRWIDCERKKNLLFFGIS